MRAVIQRVLSANASADGEVISSIGKGLCVLIGISRNDTKNDIEYIVKKILNLKLFEDTSGKRWSKSVKDCGGEILCLSQVTLYHSLKGNKLDFHHAMAPDTGKQFYSDFLEHIRREYKPELIKEGIFGAHLVIGIQNDGPVTITIESPASEEKKIEMEEDFCSIQSTRSKIEKFQKTNIVKQDSTSSQTCLIEQDSSYSQTIGNIDPNCVCSQTSKNEIVSNNVKKQDSTSSQTCLIKQDSTSSQTCLIKQDSTSSQTCLLKQDSISSQTSHWLGDTSKHTSISSQTHKGNERVVSDDAVQDSKFSQTSIFQNNVYSQTNQINQDTVSSQTCSKLKESMPSSVTTQTPAVNIS